MAAESCIANARYTYIHDDHKGAIEAVDAHHVVIRKSSAKTFFVYLSALLLTTTSFSLFLLKALQKQRAFSLLFSYVSQSIIIMPAFGVQLETHYRSGRIIHCFVPIDKILKPVLNECVTPVTCYWSLSLIVREEEELVLVFKELHPPVKMLIPIWKALCAATDKPVTLVSIR